MLRFKLHHLFAFSLLVTALFQRPAKAVGVSFDLAASSESIIAANSENSARATLPDTLQTTESPSATDQFEPLPIPEAASQPPVRITQSSAGLPRNVIASARVLTPPPAAAVPQSRILTPVTHTPPEESIALRFTPAQVASPSKVTQVSKAETKATQSDLPTWIYEGGSDSLVARVIGSAEGTRTASGAHTRAYYGHTDPGNGVWNMGTFSYQHGASSPDEADNKQLRRLKHQGNKLAKQAEQAELSMTLGEVLNGLDLANQSPRAALERGGYVDRLAEAREQGMQNSEAIVWARTYSYLNPDTQRWNAPGLGNTLPSIRRDQHRRHDAVAHAFSYYQAQREKTGKPPAGTLETSAIEIAQYPAEPLAQAKYQGETSTQQSQIVPVEFNVADSSRPESDDRALLVPSLSGREESHFLPDSLVSQGSSPREVNKATPQPHG
ncbi:MAG: hypothetical protein AAGI69_17290 [Cyanobacteria bacterium P01_H01_bin.21]